MTSQLSPYRDKNGCLVFYCINCDEHFESDERDFNQAWDEAKEQGFFARKIDGQWVHFCCEDCKNEYSE